MPQKTPVSVPVLIVGAGGAGLTASLLLSDLGIETLTICSTPGTSRLPKAHVLQQRSMEIFRQTGVEQDILTHSTPAELMSGWGWYAGVSGDTPDAGRRFAKQDSWDVGATDPDWVLASPSRQANLPQIRLEPVLLAHAEKKAPGTIQFGHELVSLEQDADGVTATVLIRATGETYTVHAQYLLGCDGGRTVGGQVGVELEGERDFIYTATVHFSADLSPYITDHEVAIRCIWTPQTGNMSVLMPMGPDWGPHPQEWVLHQTFPADDTRLWDDEKIIASFNASLGIPDFDPEIHIITRWGFEALVAPRTRVGRVFLVGDAAHRHGPTGGLGMNSAIQDASNLAWKIAAVLNGHAGDALLDTYEEERLPVVRRNVKRSTENAMHHIEIGKALGMDTTHTPEQNWAQMRRMWSDAPEDAEFRRTVREAIAHQSQEFVQHNVEYGYRYESGAIVSDGTPAPENIDDVRVYVPDTRPGSPMPHAWLTDQHDERIALHDLIHPGEFLLIADGSDEGWVAAADTVRTELGAPLRAVRIGHATGDYLDQRLAWMRRRGVTAEGAVLIRPDGVVAWRTNESADAAALRDALSAVLSQRVLVA